MPDDGFNSPFGHNLEKFATGDRYTPPPVPPNPLDKLSREIGELAKRMDRLEQKLDRILSTVERMRP
jgi:hypothetical protein